MTGDTAHELSEFGAFPWERMDDQWFRHCSGYGIGGVVAGMDFNRPTSRPTIKFVSEDMSVDVWEIPPQLARLIDAAVERGADNVRCEFRKLLDAARA